MTFLEHLLTVPNNTRELHNILIVFTPLAISNLSDGQSMLSLFVLPHSSCFLIGSSTGPLPLFAQDSHTHTHVHARAHTHTHLYLCMQTWTYSHTDPGSHKHTKSSRGMWPPSLGPTVSRGLHPFQLIRKLWLRLSQTFHNGENTLTFTGHVCPPSTLCWWVNSRLTFLYTLFHCDREAGLMAFRYRQWVFQWGPFYLRLFGQTQVSATPRNDIFHSE